MVILAVLIKGGLPRGNHCPKAAFDGQKHVMANKVYLMGGIIEKTETNVEETD
ncbi:MAG: hypothetical protein ACI843_000538 [Psychrobacter glaciei]|jgi:hypothetical protein